ncbi:MAG: hypothetical protein EOM47_00555 [Bacteroidia bacterium]|nr:hypothetical protein [Bacteroidia bacterium]
MKKYNITTDQHTEIKNREFTVVKFTTNGKEYTCYSKLMQYLISDSPVLINSETNQPESVERGEVLDIYTIAYDKGRDIFKNDIKPDASIEYLVEQYNEHYNGWKTTSEAISLFLTQSQVEKMGQAAGIRYEFEIYRQKNRSEFEPLAITLQSTQTPHPKLIKTLSIIQQKNLFDMLIDNKLLSSETDFNSFCFVFGSYLMPNDFKPLKWLKNRQLLRELITELKHPDVIVPTSKYILPNYFIDKNDKPITELPTNTPKDLKIEHYLNNLAKI